MDRGRARLRDARRIVVKLGTAVVTHADAGIALGRIGAIVEELAVLHREGRQVLLVTSGAIGMGQRALKLPERPRSLGLRQACAAVGQGQLMALYSQLFGQLGVTVAQVLLSQSDLGERDRLLCLRTTLMRLIELRVIPILNENDSVSVRELIEHRRREGEADVDELPFGDNDGLSARVALSVDADALVLLSDVDGVYTDNPNLDPGALRIGLVPEIDDAMVARARGGSAGGTGGMASKLSAAREAAEGGTAVLIASGHKPGVIARALAGEDVGSWIPATERHDAHRRAIVRAARSEGALVVNAGALEALTKRKASLLPVGVTAVIGEFLAGDVVELRDGSGRVHGRGLANYDAAACRALIGRRSAEIAAVLGWRGYDTVITRDNLVLSGV
ncbi:MAG: glutamate 5-kinase [Nannocystaceae bacterium]|nr:glutamate 5-kinase [Myxococcales bacterium]